MWSFKQRRKSLPGSITPLAPLTPSETSSFLFHAIRAEHWEKAYTILQQSHANDTQSDCVDYNGRTALHWACFCENVPVDLVKCLLEQSSNSAMKHDKQGWTPVHFAVIRSSEIVQNMVIESCPRAASAANKWGQSPLQFAIQRNRSMEVTRKLILADPYAVTIPNSYGTSPLGYFFDIWNVGLRDVLESLDLSDAHLPISEQLAGGKCKQTTSKVKDLLEKMILLLRAANGRTDPDSTEPFLLLHSALKESLCPWSFTSLILRTKPETMLERDEDGNTALHVAVRMESNETTELKKCKRCRLVIWDTKHYLFCRNCSSNVTLGEDDDEEFIIPMDKTSAVIHEIIKLQPQTAKIPNHEGKYPLHLAIEHGKYFHEGVEDILYAAPEILQIKDVDSNLLPFMAAAVEEDEDSLKQLDTIYALLKEDPSGVSWGLEHS